MENEPRTCKWCDQSLNGLHGNVLVHAECRKDYGRRLRLQKKKKEHSEYKNDLKTACKYHHFKHPQILMDSILMAEALIEDGYKNYGYKGIWIHLRCTYERDGKKISMPNNFVPFFTDLVKAHSDELHNLFHTNTRKNS